jgi:hypothetical protein
VNQRLERSIRRLAYTYPTEGWREKEEVRDRFYHLADGVALFAGRSGAKAFYNELFHSMGLNRNSKINRFITWVYTIAYPKNKHEQIQVFDTVFGVAGEDYYDPTLEYVRDATKGPYEDYVAVSVKEFPLVYVNKVEEPISIFEALTNATETDTIE